MEFFEKIRDFIKGLEDVDIYKYFAAFFAAMLIILSLFIYLHYSRVNKYLTDIKNVETMRSQTKKILSDYKAVTAQKEVVEEILAQNKDFRIGEAYQSILEKTGLLRFQTDQTTPTAGESVSGKTEILISSHFAGITMKQLTDLLLAIANVPQMYTKDIVIKKSPTMPTIDVEITVATLEPSTTT